MNFPARTALAATALAACAAAGQPTVDSESAVVPRADASSPSVLRSIGSFISKLQPAGKDAEAPADPASGTAAAAETKSSAFNIVDIQSWSKSADVVLDPQCKTLVQPFGITDSAASLSMLAVKSNLQSFVGRLTNSAQPATKTADVVKLAARGMNWLPTEVELRLGEALVPDADVLDEEKNSDSRRVYQHARAVLADIVSDLPQPLPYQFRVLVRTSSQGNASALPGGIILVDRDLFRKDGPSDYAYFVMSHEVAHVLQRHQTRAYQAQLVDGLTSLQDLGKFLGQARQPDAAAVVSYATALKRMVVKFSEDQELQADSCAIRLLAKRRTDAKLMEQTLRSIEQAFGPERTEIADGPAGGQLADHMKYLGNGVLERHPSGSRRRANLHAAYRAARDAPGANR